MVGVGEQREAEPVLVVELLLLLDRVGADPVRRPPSASSAAGTRRAGCTTAACTRACRPSDRSTRPPACPWRPTASPLLPFWSFSVNAGRLVADGQCRHVTPPRKRRAAPVACRACRGLRSFGSRRRPTRSARPPSSGSARRAVGGGRARGRRARPIASPRSRSTLARRRARRRRGTDGRDHVERRDRHPVLRLVLPAPRARSRTAAAPRARGRDAPGRARWANRCPPPPKPVVGAAARRVQPRSSRTLIATASAATAVVSFAAALFGQLDEPDQPYVPRVRRDDRRRVRASRALGALFALVRDRARRPARPARGRSSSASSARRSCARSRPSRPTWSCSPARRCCSAGSSARPRTVAFIAVVEEAPEGAACLRGVDARARGRVRLLVLGRDAAVRRPRRTGAGASRSRSARASILLAPADRAQPGGDRALHGARGAHRRRCGAGCATSSTDAPPPLRAARGRRVPDERVQRARRRRS